MRDGELKTRIIALRLHSCRPLNWAAGTGLRPGFTENSRIAIRISIAGADGQSTYDELTQWMARSTLPGAAKCLSHEEAAKLWAHVNSRSASRTSQ